MILVDDIVISSVKVFGVTLQVWGLFFIVSVLFILAMVQKVALNQKNIHPDVTFNLLLSSLIGGVIGGRLLYVLERPSLRFEGLLMWTDVSMGKMSLFGGVIGAFVLSYGYLILFRVKQKHNFKLLDLTDIIVKFLPGAFLISGIGSFLSHSLFGKVTDSNLPFMMDYGDGLVRHPVTLYHLLGDVLIFIFISIIVRIYPQLFKKNSGLLTALFLILYSFVKIVLEFFRETAGGGGDPTSGGIPSNQFGFGSFMFFTIMCVLIAWKRRHTHSLQALKKSKPIKFS